MSGFDDRWSAIAEKNPALKDERAKVTLSITELKRLLRMFYNAGEETVLPIGGELGSLLSKFRDLSQR